MDNNINVQEYGWTDSNDSNFSIDLFEEEMEPDLLSSDEDEVPFARHGPLVIPDAEDVASQREYWNFCAIGFIMDYRKFSVHRLQRIINHVWRIIAVLL